MRDVPHRMLDGIALHHYAVIDWNKKGSATQFDERQYFTSMKKALLMEEFVTRHSTVMDKYDPQKRVALVVDEWGGWYDVEPGTNPGFLFQQNTMRDAVLAGATLNIFNNHADRVKMANLAQTINVLQAVILTKEEKLILTPTYHVMEMYKIHQDAKLLPLTVTTPDYVLNEEKIPAISASASVDKNEVTHISVVNIHATQKQEVSIDVFGAQYKSVTGRILSSAKLQDFNSFDNPEKIKPIDFKGASIKGNNLTLTVPPFSVVVLEIK
jgi:alpha-N-arabinofuranosidase